MLIRAENAGPVSLNDGVCGSRPMHYLYAALNRRTNQIQVATGYVFFLKKWLGIRDRGWL